MENNFVLEKVIVCLKFMVSLIGVNIIILVVEFDEWDF